MQTRLLLLRHGATEANLEQPPRLQGRGIDGPLAGQGIRQAEQTRDFLHSQSIDVFYASPLRRALQTAQIVAGPHRKEVSAVPELIECDVGRWEGETWKAIQEQDSADYRQFMNDPGSHGYAGGETFADVARRVTPALEQLLEKHSGQTLLVVGHHVVNRVYLAGLLGLSPSQARLVTLDNCGISVVVRKKGQTRLTTLNAVFHLLETAA